MSSKRDTQYALTDLASGPLLPSTDDATVDVVSGNEPEEHTSLERKKPHPPAKPDVNETQAHKNSSLKPGSPWDRYTKVYEVKLDCYVTVATRNDHQCDLVSVKTFVGSDGYSKLQMLEQIRHDNFVTLLESFSRDGTVHAVFEAMPVSLDQILACPAYPGESELAAILGQIVTGLKYLASLNLKHGDLSCSKVLLNATGEVKILGQECCQELVLSGSSDTEDVRALSTIMMRLMQKFSKDGGAIGIEDLGRWELNSNAVGFLSAITSATSAEELLRHPFLRTGWNTNSIKWMVALAQVSAYRFYKYEQQSKLLSKDF